VSLVGVIALLLLIPWETIPWHQLGSLKALGVELTINDPEVQGAVRSILDPQGRSISEELQATLESVSDLVSRIRASRVLWIDDHPNAVLGERRLLRALGVEVIAAGSSEEARALLTHDADVDLIITDVQREGDSHQILKDRGIKAYPTHEGVNFVVGWIRSHQEDYIRDLPILFYAAYPWKNLLEFTKPAIDASPAKSMLKERDLESVAGLTGVSNSPQDLVRKAVRILAHIRADPLAVNLKETKGPTGLRPG